VSDQNENPITPAINALLRRKAAQIARQARLPFRDREDLAQDLIVELLKRLEKYDPVKAKGNYERFVQMIIRRATINILCRLGVAKRSAHSTISLNDIETEVSKGELEAEQAELARDVKEVLAALPSELREIAELLMTESIARTASILGISRHTVYERVTEIRTHFERAELGNFSRVRRTLRERTG
jgi:RNA polymerase sigma factor (sigma-70 family)